MNLDASPASSSDHANYMLLTGFRQSDSRKWCQQIFVFHVSEKAPSLHNSGDLNKHGCHVRVAPMTSFVELQSSRESISCCFSKLSAANPDKLLRYHFWCFLSANVEGEGIKIWTGACHQRDPEVLVSVQQMKMWVKEDLKAKTSWQEINQPLNQSSLKWLITQIVFNIKLSAPLSLSHMGSRPLSPTLTPLQFWVLTVPPPPPFFQHLMQQVRRRHQTDPESVLPPLVFVVNTPGQLSLLSWRFWTSLGFCLCWFPHWLWLYCCHDNRSDHFCTNWIHSVQCAQ